MVRKNKKKKYNVYDGNYREVLIQLRISSRATRFQPANYKCRASSARVLGIYDLDGVKLKNRLAYSKRTDYGVRFKYVVGTKAKPTEKFNTDHKAVCSTGIHFFLEMHEAAAY